MISVGDDYYAAKAKTGYEMIGTRVRVVNEFGEDVAQDGEEMGEIIVKGHWRHERILER